jgi:hypothetical protein
MLEMRFAGLARFIASAPIWPRPDNLDLGPERQVSAAAVLPDMPVSGLNWTRHKRPRPPKQAKTRPPYLLVVK